MQKKNCKINNLNNVGADWGPGRLKEQKGITLIALIITIIVILILVAVSVRTISESGLFGHAKNATNRWADEQNKESELGNDIGDIVSKYKPGSVDWEEVIKNAEKHPDQSVENNDIGIGTDGKPVNLDLWVYTLQEDQTYRLSSNECDDGANAYLGYKKGYVGPITDSGEIVGTVPQYIINAETGIALPITSLNSTFLGTNIIKAPVFPKGTVDTTNMFKNCIKLTMVNITEDVMSIGDYAFVGCTSLSSITIPNSVTSIGISAFSYCTSLSSITIPNSVISIGRSAFSGCTSLSGIIIPNSITSIENDTFFACASLRNITIPNNVTNIGSYAFYNCNELSSITISNSVTRIGFETFRNCTSLNNITIPNSVTSIGGSAFSGWTSSQTINCQATEKPSEWDRNWNSSCSATINWGVSM